MARTVDRVKAHPVVLLLGALVAVVTLAGTLVGYAEGLFGMVNERFNPYRSEYETLATLQLDMSSRAAEQRLGVPTRTADLCDVVRCPAEVAKASAQLLTYELDGGAVSAVYVGDRLAFYAVTARSPGFRPEIQWLSEPRGELGSERFAGVLEGVPAPADQPTDIAVAMTPKFGAYAETFAYGAPGNYQGFVLAWVPAGSQEAAFDADSAFEMATSGPSDPEVASAAATRFRATSNPNAYGEFRDDGVIASVMRDADAVLWILQASVPAGPG